jgi:hypothetical protein
MEDGKVKSIKELNDENCWKDMADNIWFTTNQKEIANGTIKVLLSIF